MVNYNALELGKVLGGNIRKTDDYRDDFIENEELKDLLLGFLKGVNVSAVGYITKWYYDLDALIWNHPVLGDLNTQEWNGGYAEPSNNDVGGHSGEGEEPEEYLGTPHDEVLF